VGKDTSQSVQNQQILSDQLSKVPAEAQGNHALDVILTVKEAEGLAARISSVSVSERIRISHKSYVVQRDILVAYLAEKGIESKIVGNCPWFVSAALTPQQINELAAEQDTPVEKIVPGSGLIKFEYLLKT